MVRTVDRTCAAAPLCCCCARAGDGCLTVVVRWLPLRLLRAATGELWRAYSVTRISAVRDAWEKAKVRRLRAARGELVVL